MRSYEVTVCKAKGMTRMIHPQTGMGVIDVENLMFKRDTENNIIADFKLGLLERAGFKCELCGEKNCLTIDHVTPLSKLFKKPVRENFDHYKSGEHRILCVWCHTARHGCNDE